jgi:hypothetical protein
MDDVASICEDIILGNAQMRGLDDSPRGMRTLFQRVLGGDEMLMPVGLTRPQTRGLRGR